MSEFLPVKPIYTGTDVVALGEASPDDVMLSPGGGIKFPDGSLQITAGGGGGSSGTLVEESPPTAAPTTLWFESDSGRMYLKYKNPDDAEVWVEANVAGVRGEVGPAGEQGAVGPAGPQGEIGLTGPAGADGAVGPAGPKGDTGDTGPAGADGAQGPAGADSTVAGPQGPAGVDGAAGPQGPAGANGIDGAQGPQGPQGAMGPAGPADWNAIPNKPPLFTQEESDARFVNVNGDTMVGALNIQFANASVGVFDSGGTYAAIGMGVDGVIWGNMFASRASNTVTIGTDTERDFVFKTNFLDRGRFTSNGQFLCGYSDQTPSNGRAGTVAAVGYNTKPGLTAGLTPYTFNIHWDGAAMSLWVDDFNLGNISLTSDYRIKSNVATLETALDKVMALKPITYTMKAVGKVFKESPRKITGFIAHECDHIEGAVDGEKDELTVNGDVQPQRLNPLPLIATLTKAMQEQQTLIQDLTARLAALETK